MSRLIAHFLRLAAAVVVLAALVVPGGSRSPETPALAPVADITQFNPGNIISDSLFFDGAAMTAADVQGFLEVKGLNCRTGSDGTPCLKNYRQDTTPRAPDAFCAGYSPAPQETAATIIAKVGASCGISQRALLVILQKEQGLVTSTGGGNLNAGKYQKAMGYACPDTAPCDVAYYGFQNQVFSAAHRFQEYAARPTAWNYRAGRTNTILYNPDRNCGSSPVYIQNQATAGLYIYTPYQPNAAAMAAGYGTGDNCSAYGNRNFWLYFTDWFGSTQRPGESAWQPLGHLDAVTPLTGNQIALAGWAVDPDTPNLIGVHAYVDGIFRGEFPAGEPRPDIAAMLPAYGERHGFYIPLGVSPGRHTVCAYALNVGAPAPNPLLGCLGVDTGGLPFGNIEAAVIEEGRALLSGWAIDLDSSSSTDVHAYVNGVLGGYATANDLRPDVGSAFPGAGDRRGFTLRAHLQPGANTVCVFAIDLPGPAANPSLGCRSMFLRVEPFGSLEQVTAGATTASVTGWAIDAETRSPIDVRVTIDGVEVARQTAGESRPDLAAYFPGMGTQHGYSFAVPAAPGYRDVCVYGVNVAQGSTDSLLGCRTVNVGVAPIGNVELLKAEGFQARVVGWALDGDTTDPIDLHVYVDGRFHSAVRADAPRPDVGAVHPASGPNHGFAFTVPLAAGRHQVCVYAINGLGGSGNPRLGCGDVVIAAGSVLPFGMLEGVAVEAGITRATGWVVEPDDPTSPVVTHFYVNGLYSGAVSASDDRPDVAAAYPGVGPAHGYTGSFVLGPGRHTVCAWGINRGAGTVNSSLGCRQVIVP